jgi:hypothetical protein
VQLHPTMIRAGQATAAQTAGPQAKVAAILLNHHVPGHFRRSKQAVFALVNREVLGDAVGVGGIVVVPAGREFLEANGIGPVTINLVGAQVSENAIGSMTPGRFQQVESADRH